MKKDITPLNEKKQRHGYWELYSDDGKIWFKRFYVNGQKIGYGECLTYGNNISLKFHL
jgi:hypothetical protein